MAADTTSDTDSESHAGKLSKHGESSSSVNDNASTGGGGGGGKMNKFAKRMNRFIPKN